MMKKHTYHLTSIAKLTKLNNIINLNEQSTIYLFDKYNYLNNWQIDNADKNIIHINKKLTDWINNNPTIKDAIIIILNHKLNETLAYKNHNYNYTINVSKLKHTAEANNNIIIIIN
jgi:hypothetical protein